MFAVKPIRSIRGIIEAKFRRVISSVVRGSYSWDQERVTH